jgi:hypothetical protein
MGVHGRWETGPVVPLEHGDGRIAVARINEARFFPGEARFRRLRFVINEALGEEERLGIFAELRAQDAGMNEPAFRVQFFRVEGRAGNRIHGVLLTNKPGQGTPGPGSGTSPAF